MFRFLHRWAGLTTAVLLITISLTGVVLSVFPMLSADRTADRLNAGALVQAVQENVDGAQAISIDDNGVVTVTAFGAEGFQRLEIDAATGAVIGPVNTGQVELWFENLHRNLFLSDAGALAVLIASGAMVVLGLSGYALAARRLGGWRKLFIRDRGDGAGGLHLKVARVAGVGIILSAATGTWMGLATLGVVPDPNPLAPMPTDVSTSAALPASDLTALTAIAGDDLRGVVLPRDGMAGAVFEVETHDGAGTVDPATGEMLTWADRSAWSWAMSLIHLLHTGQGASLLGVVLGLMSLPVPLLSVTGVMVWLGGRSRAPRVPKVQPEMADVVLLVGSEGGTTWRFANAFAKSLTNAGQSVHLDDMNHFAPARYTSAKSIVVFAATYGDGDAPQSAREFIAELDKMDDVPRMGLTILGFGDSTYPAFCGYADAVACAARAKGRTLAMDPQTVDRQSSNDFTNFGFAYGAAHGLDLGDIAADLEHRPTQSLRLVAKTMHGETAQAPTAVLRFALPKRSVMDRLLGRGFAGFEAGDLLNIIPQGDDSPRAYSLASGTRDGFAEICVRKVPGGLASTQLCAMKLGEEITAYVTPNAHFHLPKGREPIRLIGAGAGIGALAGMVRANTNHREAHLFFGMRTRSGGLPFEADLEQWEADGRLTEMTVALSRSAQPRYVQTALRDDAACVRDLISRGAHVMICGGRDMGAGVRDAIDEIIAPLGLSVRALETEGRYATDVF